MRMARPAPLTAFFGLAVIWLVVLTALWLPVSRWTSYPAAALSHMALDFGAEQWVRQVRKSPDRFEVHTSINVPVQARGVQGRGEIVVEADAARHAYGLPLLLALLFASRSKRLAARALFGYAVLLLPQAFSLTLQVLKEIVIAAPGGATQLGIAQWHIETIVLGYQLGTLLLPTLAPVVVWLWLDRTFFASVLFDGWMKRRLAET